MKTVWSACALALATCVASPAAAEDFPLLPDPTLTPGAVNPSATPFMVSNGVELCDDEDVVRASTADMLTDLGYAVVEAPSAEEALRLIRSGLLPDLLVTDHLMSGMSGTDLARIVLSQRSDAHVLLVSGYAEADGIAPDLPRLIKPFRLDELAVSLPEVRKTTRHCAFGKT